MPIYMISAVVIILLCRIFKIDLNEGHYPD